MKESRMSGGIDLSEKLSTFADYYSPPKQRSHLFAAVRQPSEKIAIILSV
jgi:hypothetical protein